MQAPDLDAPASRGWVGMSANIALVEAALGKAAWITARVPGIGWCWRAESVAELEETRALILSIIATLSKLIVRMKVLIAPLFSRKVTP